MNMRLLSVAIFLALAVTGNSLAEDLKTYKEKYQDVLKSINSDYSAQVQQVQAAYANGLMSIRNHAQSAGDLDKLKAVLAEISRFEMDQTLPQSQEGLIPEIDALRTRCQGAFDAAEQTRAEAIINLASGYDRALAHLQRELTRQGELEKATAVREERNILAATDTLTAARAMIPTEGTGQPVVSPPHSAVPPPAPRPQLNDPDRGWTVVFRASGPSIWNTDTNFGEDNYAISLDKAPAGVQFLRMKLVETGDFVIIPMNNESLGKDVNLGGYTWRGAKSTKNSHIYLSIANNSWGATYRSNEHNDMGGMKRGWGFGTGTPGLTYPGSGFNWAGQKTERKVIEISVKTDALTIPERNKLLK